MEDRYSRQSFLGSNSQEVIEAAVVGIVGLGGGGSHVVQQLAHIGFKNFELFDDDRVEESNLNRLVGATLEDVEKGKEKLEVAKRLIAGLQPLAVVNGHACKWQDKPSALQQCQLIFGCVDSFLGREELERFTRRYLIAYIDIGMDVVVGNDGRAVMGGQVIVSLPDQACMKCMGFINDERLTLEAQQYGDAGPRPQVIWPNGVLASTAVGLAVDLLTDWTQVIRGPVFLEYDGRLGTLRHRGSAFQGKTCPHFPSGGVGEPIFKDI
jgi:hypothetical protein